MKSFPRQFFGNRTVHRNNLDAVAGAFLFLSLWFFCYGLSWADETDMVWSSFLGGSLRDSGYDVALDSTGSVYVTGYTESADFPIRAGVFDETYNNNGDAFVTKLNPTGSDFVYSTFLGGFGWDEGGGIDLDGKGGVYVSGLTWSEDFPVTSGALDTTLGGPSDAFVMKLEAMGGALVYSTYLGGNGDDGGFRIAARRSGEVYVTGITESADFPSSTGAIAANHGGGIDVFVVRLNASGSALGYAILLGGGENDYSWGIAVDASGRAYVTGYTYSSDFPTTLGVFDISFNGISDVFVARISPQGSMLEYSTFLGGSFRDAARSIVVDGSASAYITGYTNSFDFPTTPEAFDPTLDFFNYNAFLTKLSPSGRELVYSTILEGEKRDSGFGLALDDSNNAWIVGFTESVFFPTTAGAFDESHNGGRDVFVAKLDGEGSNLDYGTFLGGMGDDYGWDIFLHGMDEVCVTGYTLSMDFPTTSGAFDETHNYSEDAFVTRLRLRGLVPVDPASPVGVLPEVYVLHQNYPNPFNASTEICYGIPEDGHVVLSIFNSLGQRVRALVDSEQRAGEHVIVWDGRDDLRQDVASGLYFCRLRAGKFTQTVKTILLK
jgi:hypothetical protein